MKFFLKFLTLATPAILIIVLGVLFFYRLGSHPIIDWDEGIYAQIARQSFDSGSVADLRWNMNAGAANIAGNWFEKPPLVFWLVESAYKFFGVNEWTVRFWNAFFAFGIVIISYFFSLRLFRSKIAATMAVAAFFLCNLLFVQVWYLKLDIPVTFFILLSCYLFFVAKEKNKYFLCFWLSVGLGVLTKSVVGLLPIPVIVLYSLIIKDFSLFKDKFFYLGFIVFLAVVLPWHVIEFVRYGSTFWNSYFGYHLFQRYTQVLDSHSGSFWYYIKIFFSESLFFSILFTAAFLWFLGKIFTAKTKSGSYVFIITAVIFIFLFFSLSKTKLAAYIVVSCPFLAIMIGKFLQELFLNTRIWIRNVSLTIFTLVSILLAIIFNNSKINDKGYFSELYFENKQFSATINKNFPTLNVLIDGRDTPALAFYLNKKVYNYSSSTKISSGSFILITNKPSPFIKSQPLAYGQTGVMYLVTVP